MLSIRPAAERGSADLGWLDSRHSFSFGDYYDPAHVGFGPLRVINEDRVSPARGFAAHAHRDMEIISYVVSGALAHRDSMGNGSIIRPGDVQRMTAGTGVRHSEMNPSSTEPVHFLQIWIVPVQSGLEPGYEQKTFPPAERQGRLRLVGSGDGRDGSVLIHQDVDLHAALLASGEHVGHALEPGRVAWAQVIGGELTLNGQRMTAGDGLAIEGVAALEVAAETDSELLLFDMIRAS